MTTESADTPLIRKLRFNANDTVYVETTPAWYSTFANDNDLDLTPGLPATHVHLFCDTTADLVDFLDENNLGDIAKSFWVSWPKKASGVKTDITEQTIRDLILPLNWVDTKVVAVDDVWSGLQFLRRKSET